MLKKDYCLTNYLVIIFVVFSSTGSININLL